MKVAFWIDHTSQADSVPFGSLRILNVTNTLQMEAHSLESQGNDCIEDEECLQIRMEADRLLGSRKPIERANHPARTELRTIRRPYSTAYRI